MNRDGLYFKYAELNAQLHGISPKLAIYKKVQAELAEVERELGAQGYSRKKLKDMGIIKKK